LRFKARATSMQFWAFTSFKEGEESWSARDGNLEVVDVKRGKVPCAMRSRVRG
jgi:hypothetical protein